MAKAPQAALATALVYTRAMALEEASYVIDDVDDPASDQNLIWEQIIEAIRDAATEHKLESCHLRQRSGTIPTNNANWIAIRNTLTGAPYDYTVAVRPAIGDIEIKWAN